MARGYRSRRYRPTRRIGRRFKKSSSLRKIKKDILKCNFPTKVKFMGLSERKVMFLTSNSTINLNTDNGTKSIYLNPLRTSNITSIMTQGKITVGGVERDALMSNWDKICILGVYIKMQPTKNTWSAEGTQDINEVKCTYTYNNVHGVAGTTDDVVAASYDSKNIPNKQVFTFNSNEAFTIYIPAPPTMILTDPCVHKSKTWWSLTDLLYDGATHNMDYEDEEDIEEGECEDMLGSPLTPTENPMLHCGRIFFSSEGAKYNVTINYKVALKG